jgi:hypothetical protein
MDNIYQEPTYNNKQEKKSKTTYIRSQPYYEKNKKIAKHNSYKEPTLLRHHLRNISGVKTTMALYKKKCHKILYHQAIGKRQKDIVCM